MLPPENEMGPPEYGPHTYVPLDFDLLTRQILRDESESRLQSNGEVNSRANRTSQSKFKLFNWAECSQPNISTDDIFYTASSKSHLQLRPLDVKMAVTSDSNLEDKSSCSCRLCFPSCLTDRMNCGRNVTVICWLIMAIGILIYTLSRCLYNMDFLSIWGTTEGYVILSTMILVIILGILLLVTWKKDGTKQERNDNRVSVPVSIPYETRV